MKALLLLLSLSVSGAALADDAALLHCRTIGDVAARVACYDAIPVGAAGPARASAPPAAAAAMAPAGAAVAAISGPKTAPTQLAVAPAQPLSPAAEAEKNFGLTVTQMRKTSEPDTIQSSIIGTVRGWVTGTAFRLANGQIWRVVDTDSGSMNEVVNPKVTISHGSIGSFFMDIDGVNQAPKVRRVQ